MKKLLSLALFALLLSSLVFGQSKIGPGTKLGPGTKMSATVGGPTPFVSDTFTGSDTTAITSHSPDVGSTWIRASSYSNSVPVIDNANRIRPADSGTLIIYNDATPPSADYFVSADMSVVTNIGSLLTVVVGRYDNAADTGYYAYWYGDSTNICLSKGVWNAGTTPLGSCFSAAIPDGASHNVKLSMTGSTIKLFVDGIERESVTDSTYTAAGKAGFSIRATSTNSDGWRLDNFIAQ